MEQELPRLVRKSQKGDREAFTQLLLECEQMLSRVAMAILQDPEDAADAVQDAVLAAWESLGQLRQPDISKLGWCASCGTSATASAPAQ